MQDEPTPAELIKAVADFLRNELAPQLGGHSAFKMRVAINALDLVTRQLVLESSSDAAEAARLSQLLGRQGSLGELNRVLAGRIAGGEADLQTPGLPSICGRPRWINSQSTSRTMRRIEGSWARRQFNKTAVILRSRALARRLEGSPTRACGRSFEARRKGGEHLRMTVCAWCEAYLPTHFGGRFSENAFGPSM